MGGLGMEPYPMPSILLLSQRCPPEQLLERVLLVLIQVRKPRPREVK